MKNNYFKRLFEEDRIEGDENWGTCLYYFETDEQGEVLKQIEIYRNGKILKYSDTQMEDDFGFLADQPLDMVEFAKFNITATDFFIQWNS